jgi:hypothetical protein
VLAFAPACFGDRCPSLAVDAAKLKDAESRDFDAAPQEIPAEWASLRDEARPLLRDIGIWRADRRTVISAGGSGVA